MKELEVKVKHLDNGELIILITLIAQMDDKSLIWHELINLNFRIFKMMVNHNDGYRSPKDYSAR